MKLVIHPPVERERLDRIVATAGPMAVVNAGDEGHALRHLPDADAFFGKLTPRLLALIAAVHVLHVLAAWMLVLPASARVQPAVLLPSLRRLVLIQLPVQAAAVTLLLVARPAAAPWLALVSGAAIVGLVVLLAALLLARPRA